MQTVQHTVLAVTWAEGLGAIGSLITPFALVAVGYFVNRRLKAIEAQQWRSQELQAARLRYYREIAEPLNDLMCYFVFVGSWKEQTPPQVIDIKRSLDRTFHTLVPFFSVDVVHAYNDFMDRRFATFGEWGADARAASSSTPTICAHGSLEPLVDVMFAYADEDGVPPEELEGIKRAYNEVLARLVNDIDLMAARPVLRKRTRPS